MFGLVLAIALLGIGAGGAAYSFWRSDRAASAAAFALTCALEAAAMALPFALGDRLAVFANYLQPRGLVGFGGQILSWSLVTLITVFPAAFVSGIQFPLLIGLLGRGRDKVGRDVGAAYAWNTAGAIAGSLAGGFGLMQLLSAPGCWRLVIALLAALAVGTVVLGVTDRRTSDRDGGGRIRGSGNRRGVRCRSHGGLETLGDRCGPRPERSVTQRTAQVGAAHTPHSPVGRRRARKRHRSRERAGSFLLHQRQVRRVGGWGRRDSGDGRSGGSGLAWRAPLGARDRTGDREHGRMAGSRRLDRACGRRRARAGGRADGSAAACSPVNHDVLQNPKTRIHIADARERLLASRDRYDLIFSEPSNPYRACVASLFTREFYDAAASRLNRGGLFLQWVQAYEIDADTLRTIYATIGSAFPQTETWWDERCRSASPGEPRARHARRGRVAPATGIRTSGQRHAQRMANGDGRGVPVALRRRVGRHHGARLQGRPEHRRSDADRVRARAEAGRQVELAHLHAAGTRGTPRRQPPLAVARRRRLERRPAPSCRRRRMLFPAFRVSRRSSCCTGTSMPPAARERRTSRCRSGSALDGSRSIRASFRASQRRWPPPDGTRPFPGRTPLRVGSLRRRQPSWQGAHPAGAIRGSVAPASGCAHAVPRDTLAPAGGDVARHPVGCHGGQGRPGAGPAHGRSPRSAVRGEAERPTASHRTGPRSGVFRRRMRPGNDRGAEGGRAACAVGAGPSPAPPRLLWTGGSRRALRQRRGAT